MDVKAIVLVGTPHDPQEGRSDHTPGSAAPETVFGVPIAVLPLLGRSIVVRVAERLAGAGVENVSILNAAAETMGAESEAPRTQITWKNVPAQNIWRAAEEEFGDLAQRGAELILVLRLGAYAEINLDHLLQFHLDRQQRVTQVHDDEGPLEIFVVNASRRNDAAQLLRSSLLKSRVSPCEYRFRGYTNRLRHANHYRRLSLDSLMQRTTLRPVGDEIRPGVWKAEHAKIDRGARIVAPAYIGTHSRVRGSVLVTRGSAIEHHSIVDCGTAVDNSTVLPFSYLGVGLDLCDAVLGVRQIASLKRGSVVAIKDPRLVNAIPQTAAIRWMEHLAELAAYWPRHLLRGLRGEATPSPAMLAETTNLELENFDEATPGESSGRKKAEVFETDLAVVRRYGNQ
jgi:NDP-sugar pyrophosphorylase family protein